MEKNNGLYGYYTIAEDSGIYEMTCNIDFDKEDKWYMPSFNLKDNELSWDNNEWLFYTLHTIITKTLEKELLTPEEQKEKYEITEDIPESDFPLVKEMLDKAIMLGWFDETKRPKKS